MKETITIKSKLTLRKIKSYAGIIACVAFYLSSQALAEDKISENKVITNKSVSFYKGHKSDLKQIESHLNNIKYLSAKFIQESSDGNLVEGKFFLSRPGKMRIEYLADPKIIIIVNGSILSYHDVELDEVSRLRTNTTPASFLTRPHISFSSKDVEVTNIKKTPSRLKVSVMKKNRKEAGEFSLIFSRNPLEFIKMEVKNDLDQIVGVTLAEKNFTSPISKKLFIIKKSSD